MASTHRSTLVLLSSSLLFFGGLVLGGVGLARVIEAKSAQQWPKVPGRVLSSELDIDVDEEYRHGAKMKSYRAKIRYEYVIEGRTFVGDRAYIDPGNADNEDRAYDLLHRFPADSAIEIHVNPDDPEDSVLDPSLTPFAPINPILGIVGVVVGACIFLWTRPRGIGAPAPAPGAGRGGDNA